MTKLRDVFVFAFFGLSLLPLAAMTGGITLVAPVDEKRKLAPPPEWQWPPDLPAIAKQTTSWFDDNFGLRSLLIRVKTQIDYSVFNTSDRVHIGSNGQLFYRSVLDRQKPMIENYLKLHEAEVVDGIRALNTALLARGIHLVLGVNLLSDRFVPEDLPASAPHLASPPRIDHLLAELAATPGLVFVDSAKILREEQVERPIFHKTDFHWNDPAAFGVARAVVERIASLEGRKEPVWTHKLEIEVRPHSGGIASFMPLFFPPTEQGLFVKKTWKDPPGRKGSLKERIYEFVTRVPNSDPKLLPTTVVIGDSFFDSMERSGFRTYFRNVYRARWSEKKISEIVAALFPDTRYVVVEFIEGALRTMLKFANKNDIAMAVKELASRTSAAAP